jgi:hypothetical protein
MITRWLTYIPLFDFEVRYISGNKNGGVDALFRRGQAPEDDLESSDVDEYFESRLYNTRASLVNGPMDHIGKIWLLEGKHEGQDLIVSR